MKNRILVALTAVFVLGLAVAVYAFNRTASNDSHSAMSNMENCPMKDKSVQTVTATTENHSCCDNADCCCKTGACPMKAKGEKSADCCANCCGGSCPMKNKSTETVAAQNGATSCHHDRTAGS